MLFVTFIIPQHGKLYILLEPPHHKLHKDSHNFPHARDEAVPPPSKTQAVIENAVQEYDRASTRKVKNEVVRKYGCKGSYILQQLPEHNRSHNTPVEPMHVIKDVTEAIVRLVAGVTDTMKVRLDEKARGRFQSSWIESTNAKLPSAPFSLPGDQLKIANSRANSIVVPSSFDWRPRDLFTHRGMKSHEWKEVASSGILKYCLRGLLEKNQRKTLLKFCDLLVTICSKSFPVSFDVSIEPMTHEVLALLERDFPASLHTMVIHLLHHMPYYLKLYCPIYGYWMYPFERFNCWISGRVTNRRFPESTVVETYGYFDLASFLQLSGDVPDQSVSIFSNSDLETDSCVAVNEALIEDTLSDNDFDLLCDFYYTQMDVLEQATHKTPENSCKILSTCLYTNNNRRTLTYRSELSATAERFSSSVSVKLSERHVEFGNVKFFINHSFNEQQNLLAYINWYSDLTKDAESGLLVATINSEVDRNPYVYVSSIEEQLVIAQDEEDCNKVRILNA